MSALTDPLASGTNEYDQQFYTVIK